MIIARTYMLNPILESQTSIFSSPEQTRSRSSPVPVPDRAEIAIGDSLVDQQKSLRLIKKRYVKE